MMTSEAMTKLQNIADEARILRNRIANGLECEHNQQDQRAVRLVLDELDRAREKWPDWPNDVIHQAAIVGEESGELLQAALQARYEDGGRCHLETEAIHTAAMCLRLLCDG